MEFKETNWKLHKYNVSLKVACKVTNQIISSQRNTVLSTKLQFQGFNRSLSHSFTVSVTYQNTKFLVPSTKLQFQGFCRPVVCKLSKYDIFFDESQEERLADS